MANAFIVDQVQAKYKTIGTATTWLQGRLNELRAQASSAERAVVEYKAKNNIVDSGGGRLINEQQLAELNSAVVKARIDALRQRRGSIVMLSFLVVATSIRQRMR